MKNRRIKKNKNNISLVFIIANLLSSNVIGLTCPESITFTCQPAEPSVCKDIENPTICSLVGWGQIWDFVAPYRNLALLESGKVESGKGKSSCSLLPAQGGNPYKAFYGMSYYGLVNNGKGTSFLASYCIYILNQEQGVAIAGLMSRNFVKNPQEGLWIPQEKGWFCQNARDCGFSKIT